MEFLWTLRKLLSFLLLASLVKAEHVAVCIAGRLRAVQVTGESQRRNLYDPLCGGSCEAPKHIVDIFMAGPLQSEEQLLAAAEMMRYVPKLVKGVRFQDESVILQYLATTFPEALQEALQIRGNWLGTLNPRLVIPGTNRIHRRGGQGIFALHVYHQCLEMIEAREKHLLKKYDRIVVTRTDLQWVFPHPRLEDLSFNAAWIPDTLEDDWGGVYDRHLLFPRWAADAVLGGWSLLTSGKAFQMSMDILGPGALESNNTNTEFFLAVRLFAGNVAIARYPSMAYLACDAKEWRTVSNGLAVGAEASMHGPRSSNFVCQPGGHRYPKEWAAVQNFSQCFSLHDSGHFWSQKAIQKCYCERFGFDFKEAEQDLYQICHDKEG